MRGSKGRKSLGGPKAAPRWGSGGEAPRRWRHFLKVMHKYFVYWGFAQYLKQINPLFNISRGQVPPLPMPADAHGLRTVPHRRSLVAVWRGPRQVALTWRTAITDDQELVVSARISKHCRAHRNCAPATSCACAVEMEVDIDVTVTCVRSVTAERHLHVTTRINEMEFFAKSFRTKLQLKLTEAHPPQG